MKPTVVDALPASVIVCLAQFMISSSPAAAPYARSASRLRGFLRIVQRLVRSDILRIGQRLVRSDILRIVQRLVRSDIPRTCEWLVRCDILGMGPRLLGVIF